MAFEIRPTAVPGLDTILGAGLPRGTLLLIAGPPGTGKTILTQQICFAWVRNGDAAAKRKAIYFSTMSEPHAKLIEHSEQFSFFDHSLLGHGVDILALQEAMNKGLDETANAIVHQTRQAGADLVVIDGFRALEAVSDGPRETRSFLYKLSSQLGMLGVTAIITVERPVHDPEAYGEFTIADAVLGLHNDVVNVQNRRRIEVVKLRGMAHLSGLHSYRINTDGWRIFPRLESLIQFEDAGKASSAVIQRHSFAISGLDQLTHGGMPNLSATLLAGSPGIGKTLLSLYFLAAGADQGEPGLLLSFHEDREQLLNKARRFGLDINKHLASGMLTVIALSAVELELDEFSNLVRHEVESRKTLRVVIDSALPLELAAGREDRAADYAAALHVYLRQKGVTTIFTQELNVLDGVEPRSIETPLAVVCENLIIMRYAARGNVFDRVLRIMKMRDSEHSRAIHEFTIETGKQLNVMTDTYKPSASGDNRSE